MQSSLFLGILSNYLSKIDSKWNIYAETTNFIVEKRKVKLHNDLRKCVKNVRLNLLRLINGIKGTRHPLNFSFY